LARRITPFKDDHHGTFLHQDLAHEQAHGRLFRRELLGVRLRRQGQGQVHLRKDRH